MDSVHEEEQLRPEVRIQSEQQRGRKSIRRLVCAVVRDESGQNLVEYGLIAGLIGLGCIATMHGLQNSLATAFSKLGNAVINAS